MAYIGKVTLSQDWEKLEDLIKDQVDGQGSFAFENGKDYSLQVDSPNLEIMFGAYVCVSENKPALRDDGEHLTCQSGFYTAESGVSLWVKIRGNTTNIKMAVSEIG